MRIGVLGLGYVGVVTAACLAERGHRVLGVDVAEEKVALINQGRSPILEDQVDELIARAVGDGRLAATQDHRRVAEECDLALVCVGTPSDRNGGLDTRHVERVAGQMGRTLGECGRSEGFTLVFRSTMLPGTTRRIAGEALAPAAGEGCRVVFHPEFLREGSAVKDFWDPPKIVAGEMRPGAAGRLLELYQGFSAPVFVTSLEVAEMVKYADNAFHAVKITFANEMGQAAKALGVDGREVMKLFCADTRLNISPAYLRPGFAFGGSCLPKDLRALTHAARHRDLRLPLLESVLPSNQSQIEGVVERIEREKPKKVALMGLAFKPGTDDLRESPLVELAERLLGKGYEVCICDPQVEGSRLVGGNLAFVEQHLPHLSRLLASSPNGGDPREMVVLGHPVKEQEKVREWLGQGRSVLDLCGDCPPPQQEGYQGLYW